MVAVSAAATIYAPTPEQCPECGKVFPEKGTHFQTDPLPSVGEPESGTGYQPVRRAALRGDYMGWKPMPLFQNSPVPNWWGIPLRRADACELIVWRMVAPVTAAATRGFAFF